MRKFTLFFSLFVAVATTAMADFTQTYVKTDNGAFWGSAVTTYPDGVTNVKPSNASSVFAPTFMVEVTTEGTVTVSFEHKTGYHGLNVLGVDILNPNGTVAASSYAHKIAGGGSNAGQKVYTLENVSKGFYTLRYFVCNITSSDDVTNAGGDVVVTSAVLATALPRTTWSVAASSQETIGDPGQATNAIDGVESTFWHTVYANNYPHWIEFNMNSIITVSYFDYVSRFDNTTSNGNILNYKLYISDEPMNGTYTNATEAASGTFVYGSGTHHIIGLETPVSGQYVALVAESGTAGNWSNNAAATAANCTEFYVYGTSTGNEAAKAALNSLIEQVVAWNAAGIIGEGVGQRSSTNENAVNDFNAIVEYYNGITEETESSEIQDKADELQAIIDSYSIINMPVDGKAYTFKNVQKDGTTVCWFKYFAEQDSVGLTYTESEATPFICRQVADGKYTFVNNAGKYMTWRGDNANNSNKTGVKDAYDASTEAWTDITVAQMVAGSNVESFGVARYVTLYGRRQPETEDRGKFAYFVIEKNNGSPIYDQAAAPFYNSSYSSAFIMDEVEYANKPVLNAVGTSPLLTSELHNKAMATFSAPFATVVPEGVTAYYATAGDGFVTLNAVAATAAIPANTGVILVGTEAGSITMAPAAGETAATIENNVLANTAGAAKDIPADSYILSAFNDEAGFYRTTAGELAMNKAYIAAESQNQSIEVRFPGTTAVEKVEMRNEKEEIYDLQGRKINEITQPGIYVVNGVKRVVK